MNFGLEDIINNTTFGIPNDELIAFMEGLT